jgi:hypothetical protein
VESGKAGRADMKNSPHEPLCAVVYLQQIKKKAKAEGKTCHTKTMLSLEQPIKLL